MHRRLLTAAVSLLAAVGAVPAAAAPGPASAPEYWFDAWRVPELWAAGARGQGVTIAVIDTGVNAALPQLAGRVLRGIDLGAGGDGRTDRAVDPFGHGTAMAALMVARPGPFGTAGLAPDSRVLPIAVPLAGTTDASRDDDLPAALRWSVDHGADIVSLSLAGGSGCQRPEQAAISYALRHGAAVFAAAGNRGRTDSADEDPGDCRGVVSVGAVGPAGEVAAFSSRHRYLTLTAPGVDVASLSRRAGRAFAASGTSSATALTAASAALVWSAHPRLSATQVVARLLATLDRPRRSRDPAYGYGRLDTYRAVTASVPADAPDPVHRAAAPFLAPATQAPGARAPAVIGFAVLLALAVGLVRVRRRRVSAALGPAPPG